MIELRNLYKDFIVDKKRFTALDNVSLVVKKGSIYGIIGESGAGKSTLLRCVNLLEHPSRGQVIVDGQDLTKLNIAHLKNTQKNIGMIFQHFNLLSQKDVFDNVALPLKLLNKSKEEQKQLILPILEYLGILEKANNYPHELSGGQKQRVAIARALVMKPKILLCDEATSALDSKTTQNILGLLEKINEEFNITILLITHELDVVKSICQRVALMYQGKIIEEASVIDFFTKPKTSIGKEMVATSLKMTISEALKRDLKPNGIYPILRLTFRGKLIREALISRASREFNIDISILESNIEFISHRPVGFLLCELRGNKDIINNTLAFFTAHKLEWEVVGHVG